MDSIKAFENKSLLKHILSLLLAGSCGIVASLIHMSSYEIVMFRTLIGSLLLIALYLMKYKHFTFYRYKKSFVFLCLSGCSMGVSWMFLYEAYRQIGVSLAILGYYCGAIIVMMLSPILFKEKLTKQKIICFFIVFTGLVLANGIGQTKIHSGFGVLCALMSALMYACMVLFNKKAEEIPPMENATLQLTTAFICVFIFVIAKQGFHFSVAGTDIAPLLFLGIVNTGIGCFLYFSSIGDIKVQTVAVLGFLEPLSAIIFSYIFLKEVLAPVQLLGAVLIICGAVFAEINLPIAKN